MQTRKINENIESQLTAYLPNAVHLASCHGVICEQAGQHITRSHHRLQILLKRTQLRPHNLHRYPIRDTQRHILIWTGWRISKITTGETGQDICTGAGEGWSRSSGEGRGIEARIRVRCWPSVTHERHGAQLAEG
jgi:hypothetical protein